MKGKTVALTAIGSALVLSFAVFTGLLVRYNRAGDPNNEDAILERARAAEEIDDSPKAADNWRRLVALNPFKEEYKRSHYHSLVRMRAFQHLASYTNDMPLVKEMTANERLIEDRLLSAWQYYELGSNDVARALFHEATNLNYYASTPLLIDFEVRLGRIEAAIDAVMPYIARFQTPRLMLSAAEWCAITGRTELIDKIRSRAGENDGYATILFGYYCDALEAWAKGDTEALVKAENALGDDTFRTPLAKLMKLEAAAAGDDVSLVSSSYMALKAMPEFLDFAKRGKLAAKRFIAVQFNRRVPIQLLGRLAERVLVDGDQDLDMIRVSLLGRLETHELEESDVADAERRFPEDKGVKLIREWYDKSKSL